MNTYTLWTIQEQDMHAVNKSVGRLEYERAFTFRNGRLNLMNGEDLIDIIDWYFQDCYIESLASFILHWHLTKSDVPMIPFIKVDVSRGRMPLISRCRNEVLFDVTGQAVVFAEVQFPTVPMTFCA